MSPRAVRRRTSKKKSVRRVSARQAVQRMTSWHLGTQIAIAVSAMAVLAVLGVVDRNVFSAALGSAQHASVVTADIGLEHDTPAAVDMLVARKGTMGHVEISNTSSFPLKVSLPEEWHRTVVRGGSIWLVVEEDPEFGFIRWTLPAKMSMVMTTAKVPDEITFHSPSGQTASVRVTAVDVAEEAKYERTLLFQTAAQAKLWVATE